MHHLAGSTASAKKQRVTFALATMVVMAPALASAQESESSQNVQDRHAAAEAFDRGTSRYIQHDYAAAANWFETADRLVPAATAVQSAIEAHRRAGGIDHLARAATLALRLLSNYSSDSRSTALANRTIEQLGPQLGRINVQCGQCEVEIDAVLQSSPEFFVSPGSHSIIGRFSSGSTRQRTVEVAAGAIENVALEAPPPADVSPPSPEVPVVTTDRSRTNSELSPRPQDHHGGRDLRMLHPAFAIGGIAGTAVLGGLAIWSWIDAQNSGRQLLINAADGKNTTTLERSVNAAEARTVALDIATGVVGVATVVTAVFFTRWQRPSRVSVAPTASTNGFAGVTMRGIF